MIINFNTDRDGVILSRICEIMFDKFDISKQLRVPANSRLQKVFNSQVFY